MSEWDRIWADGDLSGDAHSWRSCSGGRVELKGNMISHWGKLQPNTARFSGKVELKVAQGISEGSGVVELCKGAEKPMEAHQNWRCL